MRQPLRKIFICMIVGAFAGASLDLLAHFLGWAELRNFQLVLLEMSYQGLAGLLPAKLMRALSTAWGEMVVLGTVGSVIGLSVGVVLYTLTWRVSQRWSFSTTILSLSATIGIFTALFGVLWCRIVLFHSNKRMVLPEGFAAVFGSVGIGLLVGVGLHWLLHELSRYRLTKVGVAGSVLALLVGYLGSSSIGGAVPAHLQQNTTIPTITQVVLLGADGATWDVALPMIKEGKLPNLAKLMARGSWGDIRTTLPWKSPILWASIATGKREQAHGIHDFVVRDHATHAVIPVSLSSRKVKAIWDIVSDQGLRTDVVNWYAGWPAEPLKGTMVSYRFLHQGLADRVFPPERTREIDELVERLDTAGLSRDERMIAEVGLSLLQQDQPNLHLLYLRDIDGMQHLFWRDHAARRGSRLGRWLYGPVDPAEVAEKGRRIEEAYEQLDVVLGRILQLAGPQTAVVVVSDHGGGIKAPGQLYFTLNPVLEQWGLLRYLPDRKTIDWTNTQVYDATERPWYEQRELFINRRPEGPFRQGVSEGTERQLLEPLVGQLKHLKTTSGNPVVTKAWVRASRSEGRIVVARMNVKLKESDTVQGQESRLSVSQVVWRTSRSGTHRAQGILVMAGPGIRAGYRLRAASILDITPTLLYFLGLPVADDMEGRVLLEAIEPAVRKARPVHMVATYETGPARAALPTQPSPADEEQLEQLRALGYIQ